MAGAAPSAWGKQILTTAQTPVGVLEGYVVLSHRLLSLELAMLCHAEHNHNTTRGDIQVLQEGVVEISKDFSLVWESSAEVVHLGQECAFRFLATVVTAKKDPAGSFEGNIVLTDRLGELDLWNFCSIISPQLGACAEEIMEHRWDLCKSRFFYFDTLGIEPPFRSLVLGPAVLRKIVQIGEEIFGVRAYVMRPYPIQYQGRPAPMGETEAFKRDKERLISYFREHLPIRPLRPDSSFYVWELE